MNATERRELRKIVDARIASLELEFKARQAELGRMIRKRIMDENAAKIADIKSRFDALIAEAHEAGFQLDERNDHRNGKYQVVGMKVWPEDLDDRVDEELRLLREEHDAGSIRLSQLKLQLHEELLLGSMESEEARSFLARIPSVDTLLPAPAQIAAG